jgi:hypothetical protein
MIHRIGLAALLPFAVFVPAILGQTLSLNVKAMPEHGLTIYGYADAHFVPLAAGLLDSQPEQLKPFCFLLTNNAPNRLVAYTLRWTFVNQQGVASDQFTRFTQINEMMDQGAAHGPIPRSTYSVGPGESRMLSPLFNVATPKRIVSFPATAGQALIVGHGADRSLTLELDAALFDNGDFYGTDRKGLFVRVQTMLLVRQQFFQALLGSISDGELDTMLHSATAGVDLDHQPADSASPAALGVFYKAYAAEPLIALNRAKGSTAVRNLARKLLYTQTPTLTRK